MAASEVVDDSDALLRRVPNNPAHWERTDEGLLRVSSAVFQRSKPDLGVSVDVRRLLPDPREPTSALGDRVGHGLIEFLARVPRDYDLDVVHAPVSGNPAHANIVGFPEDKVARARVRLELSKAPYEWVRYPAGACLE